MLKYGGGWEAESDKEFTTSLLSKLKKKNSPGLKICKGALVFGDLNQ